MANRNNKNRDAISLNDAIEGFLESKRDLPTSSDQDSAVNILKGKNGDKFLEYYGESGTSKDDPIEELAFADAVEAFVRGYTRDKDSAIAVYKKFTEYLKRQHNILITIQWPRIRLSDTMQRIKYLNDRLQDPDTNIQKISDELWISTRQLETDFAVLKGDSKEPQLVGGLPLAIKEIERKRSQFSFESTASILSCTLNVSELIALLEGLHMAEGNVYHSGKAKRVARLIWQQLSDYTKDRLKTVAREGNYDCDMQWLCELDGSREKFSFISEMESTHRDIRQVLVYCMKCSNTVRIEYREGDELRIYEGTICGPIDDNMITLGNAAQSETAELMISNIESINPVK